MTQPELRIGDREREAAVTALGEHYVAGRLTKEEYEERSGVAWLARTNSDLVPLFLDLPPSRPPQQHLRSAPATASAWAGDGRHPAAVAPRAGNRLPVLPLVLVFLGLAMLTDVWVVLLVVGVLWWVGFFRWMRRMGGRHNHRC